MNSLEIWFKETIQCERTMKIIKLYILKYGEELFSPLQISCDD